jgi:hypothetical protein
MSRGTATLLVLLLAACAGPQWTKPGVSDATAAADYSDCRAEANQADTRDADIQSDIMASRGHDWAQSGTLGAHQSGFAAENQARSGDVMASCMRLKGYATP